MHEENEWLDVVAQNVSHLKPSVQRSLALFALFQSCLAKRPYNLFHRANLYMRTAHVERKFGNKTTWDKPFSQHFWAAVDSANTAVFDNGRQHTALCSDFREVQGAFDLVYMDPPYVNAAGTGVDYLDFYHFLEGLADYESWPEKITLKYKHRPFVRRPSPWLSKAGVLAAFDQAVDRYRDSIIVISYRSDGSPTVEQLTALLSRHGRRGATHETHDYKYVLASGRGKEVLLVSEP